LTAAVLASLEPRPGEVALDLYCGAGLFAGALAPVVGPGGMVVGVEADDAAVRDARHNLREWPWARVHKGDVASVLTRGGLPPARLAVADPPRSGLAREVIDYLSAAQNGAGRLAYVSCDPATLARDIGLLTARGWTLGSLRRVPYDPPRRVRRDPDRGRRHRSARRAWISAVMASGDWSPSSSSRMPRCR
jgi:tRNA/tmRNA/rRNA uracil-C5-methylase (TrmA/RlmC/RlmD family)